MLNSPRLLNLPLLLLANKQDSPTSLSVAEIRESFDAWGRARQTSGREEGETAEEWDDGGAKNERLASLDVMGVSALEGSVASPALTVAVLMIRTGVRDAINWLYIRVQNARKMYVT